MGDFTSEFGSSFLSEEEIFLLSLWRRSDHRCRTVTSGKDRHPPSKHTTKSNGRSHKPLFLIAIARRGVSMQSVLYPPLSPLAVSLAANRSGQRERERERERRSDGSKRCRLLLLSLLFLASTASSSASSPFTSENKFAVSTQLSKLARRGVGTTHR